MFDQRQNTDQIKLRSTKGEITRLETAAIKYIFSTHNVELNDNYDTMIVDTKPGNECLDELESLFGIYRFEVTLYPGTEKEELIGLDWRSAK